MVCPEPFTVALPLLAADFTCVAIWANDCNAVLAVSIVVLILVIVVVNADRFDSCARAKIANPSLTPIPE